MALTIVSLKLSSEAVCGVTLEPYLQVRKGTSTTVSGEDVPEEGVSDARYVLRYRWYRSVHRGGQICWVSTDSMACTGHSVRSLGGLVALAWCSLRLDASCPLAGPP